MWSVLSADARLYCTRLYPKEKGTLNRAFIWVRSPGLLVLAFQRVHHCYQSYRETEGWSARTIGLRLILAVGRWPIAMLAKCDVSSATQIGPEVYLSDRGQLILGPRRIGSGTVIHHRVTIGTRSGEPEPPVIGRNVWIGPGCVIYGNITVGDCATVLPGSVVSMNVRPGAVVGGNPATVVYEHFDNSRLRRSLAADINRESLETV